MADGRQRNLGQPARNSSSPDDARAADAQPRDTRAHAAGAPEDEAGANGSDGHAHVGESAAAAQRRSSGWRAGRTRDDSVGQHSGQNRAPDPPDRASQDRAPDVLTNGLADAGPGFRVYRNARDSVAAPAREAPARAPAPRPSDSAPTPPLPKAPPAASKPSAATRPRIHVPRCDRPGDALSEAMSKNQKLDDTARATLTKLMDRMKEWHSNDYIPDADIGEIDANTLKLAGELLQAEPELGELNEYDVTAPGQSAQDVERAVLADHEVRFGDFIERKRQQYNTSEDSGLNIAPAAEEDHTRKLFDDEHGDQHDTTETRSTPKNIIRIDDPEDALGRQDTGILKPADIQEKFLAPGMIRDDNPGKFLTNPAMLQLSSVKNFTAWINRYRLLRDKEIWTEKMLMEDFCEEALKYVNKKYAFHRFPSSLRFVFFVEIPLFVFCVFARRLDKENEKKYLKPGEKDIKPAHRKYAWAGHLFCVGRDGSNDPVELPPSTFQFKPPANLYSNEPTRVGSRDGWE